MKELHEQSDRELRQTIHEAEQLLRERAEERRRQEQRARDLRVMGEYLNTNEYVNCGNCKKCQDGGKHHGPYCYLYYRSTRAASGLTSKYIPKNRVEAERQRLNNKRREAEEAIAEMGAV